MSVRKLSVSLPDELAEAAGVAAARDGIGLSAWLAKAARSRLEHEQALDDGHRAARELIAEYQARHGSDVSAHARAWSDAVLADIHRSAAPNPSATLSPALNQAVHG